MPLTSLTNLRSGLIAATLAPLMGLAATGATAQSACAIPSDWATAIPDPIDLAKNSAFNSLCDFHTWSWNAFLWSMEDVEGAPRFIGFPTVEQVIDQSWDGAPQTHDGMRLHLRAGKSDHPIDSIAQAGTTGILVAQNNRAVYYSQYVNPQMYKQIQDDNWFTAQGLTDESPEALFDIGNIEYKAAWAIVDDTFQVPGAYTRQAIIPKVATVTVNGVPTITVPENPEFEAATVALVGFHVVGWVNGHSEAIWASFSPTGIAPVVPQNNQGEPAIGPGAPVSDTGTPFYAAGTKLQDCNQTQVPVQKVNADTQEFALTTQACQVFDTGSLLPSDARNDAVIKQINASAASVLPDGNVAKTYEEVGAIWTISDFRAFCDSVPSDQQPAECSASPQPTSLQNPSQISGKLDQTFQDMLEGSTVLSNPVIETFTQTDVAQDNCFACHNSLQYQPNNPSIPPLHSSMLNLSHILMQVYVADQSN